MNLKTGSLVAEKAGDEVIQKMLTDILLGLKTRLVKPVMEGNTRIAGLLDELEAHNQARLAELLERLDALENEVQKLPLVILAALRDAINQAGGGTPDES
ncbi:hypothetical protein [Pelotomaculum propionicicum]|uniref:Uncharacterized protein n=1 Tax=Pelotomaculum propionicicum TaxID=258475 RepID=A0A4Y7RU13_9FIRM|nr:hypothetical protein [Pelotomaculum propionicicum]TEB12363.1 hypothetical protein Pmgp_00980 [Pelotomaculum propionicicum]